MKKHALISTAIVVVLIAATSAFAGVTVSSPTNGSTVGTTVNFVATASSSCSKGVASMGIYPSSNWLVYTVNGSSLNTNVNLNPGTYNAVVEAWDYCGGATTRTITHRQVRNRSERDFAFQQQHGRFPGQLCRNSHQQLLERRGLNGHLQRAWKIGIRREWGEPQHESFVEPWNVQHNRRGMGQLWRRGDHSHYDHGFVERKDLVEYPQQRRLERLRAAASKLW